MNGYKTPEERVLDFLRRHEKELDDDGGMFSSGPKLYTIAPFIVKYIDELMALIGPEES